MLPCDHPVRRLLQYASDSPLPSWAQSVTAVQQRQALSAPIPDITQCFHHDELCAASSDPESRKTLLAQYKRIHISPTLRTYDQVSFATASYDPGWPFADFQASAERLPDWLIHVDVGLHTWRTFRAWQIMRTLGRWPLAVYGIHSLPRTLVLCPLCQAVDADIVHLLAHCSQTAQARVSHVAVDLQQLKLVLFQYADDPLEFGERLVYIDRCMERVTSCMDCVTSPLR